MLVCSFFDQAAGVYARPFFPVSRGMALRLAADEVNRPAEDNPLYRHPGDFGLFLLGEMDDNSGLIVPLTPPERLALCSELKYQAPSSPAEPGFSPRVGG